MGFISLQDLLEFINWVNIFMHPHFMYACVYDGRNNLRFIPKGIWIYWKVPIIPIKISPGSCWIGWKWSRRKRKDCGNRWWLKMNHVNHTANQEKSVLSRLSSMISYAVTIWSSLYTLENVEWKVPEKVLVYQYFRGTWRYWNTFEYFVLLHRYLCRYLPQIFQ